MRRLFLTRLIMVCVLCALPTFAIADIIDFELQTLDQTSATVKVTFNHGFGCIGPCRQETVNIWVTPCPPGQTCINGEPVYHVVAPNVPKEVLFTLQPGQTYTFRAYYMDQGSSGGQCEWNCESAVATPEVQYHVPEAPVWDIQPVSSSIDTVWVDARFSDVDCAPATACQYKSAYTRYAIWPCPLVIVGNNPNVECVNGALSYRLYSTPPVVRLALKAGVTYTFAGHMTEIAYCLYNNNPCGKICCDVLAHAVPREYAAATVAVKPITWGAVKSMYRSP